MTWLKWLALIGFGGYLGVVLLLYVAQRSLLYFPDPVRRPPSSVGFSQAEEIVLRTSDGERLIAWHAPPRAEQPIVLYLQGNGGGLDLRAHRFARLAQDGIGVLALNYRGFGGSTGRPTEAGLMRDGETAIAFMREHYAPGRVVLWGESLGTGLAVAIAAKHPVARVLLESPYTSVADVAASIYFFVPVRWLLKDQFRSDALVGEVTAPILVVHGASDVTIPIAFGQRLYSMVRAPKQFLTLPRAGHDDHDEFGALEKVLPFIAHGLE
jgi:fermentation-respiration switch protein FrsA (DUF1100 family)